MSTAHTSSVTTTILAAALLVAAGSTHSLFATPSHNGFSPSDMDRPLSTWSAGNWQAPDTNDEFDVPPPDGEEPGGPTFLGEELTGSDFVFVLDRSGSMAARMAPPAGTEIVDRYGNVISNPTRWQVIQSETANAIQNMTSEESFELILFTTIYSVCFNELRPADGPNKTTGVSFIYNHNASGGTGFHAPLRHAFSNAGYDTMDTLIFMTDGYPFDGAQTMNDYPGWVSAQHASEPEFETKGYQLGGGSLNSFMSWLAGQAYTTVSLH